MLRPARIAAAVLAATLAAPALVAGLASAAQADAVRQQELWVLNAINVAGAWQRTHGSGVTVALIDSGVNGQVSDLSGSVTTGRDFSGVSTPRANPNWGVHGTWMASLIAGHGHDPGGPSGIMGVAPAAKILSIRAVTDQGDPGYRRYQHESETRVQGHLAAAIRYATSRHVGVISMSLGYQGASLPVRSAISAALAQGIVVVASSGNSGDTRSRRSNAPYSFPADYPGVLGVGAVAQDGQPAGFSSDNLSVQVAAPGVRVPAQGRDGQYWLVSGTSPACALTAGVAALIKSVYPSLAPALVVEAITASTAGKPHGGYDQEVGFGTVNATAALKMAGRLARGDTARRGLVAAAAQFGGGPAAIPPDPVAPRAKSQLVTDSLMALACLTLVLVVAFRLIVTRRAAVAVELSGAGVGLPGPAAHPAAGRGSEPAGSAPPAGYGPPAGYRPAGYGPPAGYRPAGYGPPEGYGAPAGYRPPGAYEAPGGYRPLGSYGTQGNSGPPESYGPPGNSGTQGNSGPAGSYGPPGSYGTQGNSGPPGSSSAPGNSGPPGSHRPPDGYLPPGDNGAPWSYRAAGGREAPGGFGMPGSYRAPGSYLSPDGDQSPDGHGTAGGYESPDGHGAAGGYQSPAGHQPPDGYRSPDGHGAAGGYQSPAYPPVPGYGAQRPPGDPAQAGTGPQQAWPPRTADPPPDPPGSDDDTWPTSGRW